MTTTYVMNVTPTGTTRRLRALCASGWTQRDLAKHFGIAKSAVTRMVNPEIWDAPWEVDVDRMVALDYPNLVDGPNDVKYHVVRDAKKAGWATPECWEGREMDDPDEIPGSPQEGPAARQLRGVELARHVYSRMQSTRTAHIIAITSGYSTPERCAQVLAAARYAHLGRELLHRHQKELRAQLFSTGGAESSTTR